MSMCSTLVRSRELVSEQLSRSYVVRLLHKEREAEQLQFIAVKVKTAYDILMVCASSRQTRACLTFIRPEITSTFPSWPHPRSTPTPAKLPSEVAAM